MASQTLQFDCAVFDLDFHPKSDYLGVGLVDGTVSLHGYDGSQVLQATPSTASLRSVRFSNDGSSFICGSADGTLSVFNVSGELIWQRKESHGGAGNGGKRVVRRRRHGVLHGGAVSL